MRHSFSFLLTKQIFFTFFSNYFRSKRAANSTELSKKKSSSNNNVIYVVASLVSGSNEDPSSSDVVTDVFRDENKARRYMRERAKQLYYVNVETGESSEGDAEETDDESEGKNNREGLPVSEGSRGRFFCEGRASIEFGEDKSKGFSYSQTWGFVTIRKVTIDEDP